MYNKKKILALDTRRLLIHYRKIRKKQYHYICGCCSEFIWDIGIGDESDKNEYNELIAYLQTLKIELANREHIPNIKIKPKIREKKSNRRS